MIFPWPGPLMTSGRLPVEVMPVARQHTSIVEPVCDLYTVRNDTSGMVVSRTCADK